MSDVYASAGVSIDAGDEAVRRIGPIVAATNRPGVLGGIGGFGGMFELDVSRFRRPVLVSATDGVGTKLEVARMAGRFDTIGIDLVAMCVDDLVCCGAEPLYMLDYLAVERLDPDMAVEIVRGIATGCQSAGCALIGGEMAEHPGTMAPGQFDVAGFAVGIVDRDRVLDGSLLAEGDVLVGLASPGLRSNGYSLARKILLADAGRELGDPCWDAPDAPSVGEELLRPSVIYSAAVLPLIEADRIHALAHITGGGVPGNLPRVLDGRFDAFVDESRWPCPEVFSELARLGEVPQADMRATFNMGVGMIAAVSAADAGAAIEHLAGHGVDAYEIGELRPGTGRVIYAG